MVAEIATIITPVLITALIGFLWARSGAKFDTSMITSVVMTVGTPCLVIDTFLRVRPDAGVFVETLMAGICLYIGFATVGLVTLRLAKLSYRDYLGAMLFPNMGNMGLPLCLFAFGDAGLALAIVLFALSAIGNFTIGTSIAAGRVDPKLLARSPIIYAVLVALVIVITGFEAPQWAANTFRLLGGLTIPLMLMALGVSLSRLKAKSLLKSGLLSLVRMVGGFLVGLAVSELFGLEGAARGVVVLQASMPTAVFNYLFAERYGRAAPEVAGMVLISTLLSFATLPLLLWYLL